MLDERQGLAAKFDCAAIDAKVETPRASLPGSLARCLRRIGVGVCAAALLVALVPRAGATVPKDTLGQVARLPQPFHAHWVWVSDLILDRAALIDVDSDRVLGMIDGGWGTIMPLFSRQRPEIYLPATYYSRRTRGQRTDALEIYDASTLANIGEVLLPPKRAVNAVALGHAAISDDGRFVAVFDWTTGTALSIVDVVQRKFTAEIPMGCSLVYAAGARRFLSLCADGSALTITLDDAGHEVSRAQTKPFFNPRTDPVTEKAVRWHDQWLFVSFAGTVHPVDVSGPEIRFGPVWSLVNDADRAAHWRIGGLQHSAVLQRSGRLYVLMHQGGADTHKQTGTEVWVFDVTSHRRLLRIKLVNPGLTVYGFPVQIGRHWVWPFNHLWDWTLNTFVPAAVSAIQVTQGADPLLVTASQYTGSLGIYDAMTGNFLRRVEPTGWTSDIILAPYGGGAP